MQRLPAAQCRKAIKQTKTKYRKICPLSGIGSSEKVSHAARFVKKITFAIESDFTHRLFFVSDYRKAYVHSITRRIQSTEFVDTNVRSSGRFADIRCSATSIQKNLLSSASLRYILFMPNCRITTYFCQIFICYITEPAVCDMSSASIGVEVEHIC